MGKDKGGHQVGIGAFPGRLSPNLRYMKFVDGTNFLTQMAEELKIELNPYKPSPESIIFSTKWIKAIPVPITGYVVRNYWFGSYVGDKPYCTTLTKELRNCNFEPVLFQKIGSKEKGVDIGLAKEMLVNAFNQNFDVGWLFAGDEDYVGSVKEVKRYGQIINGSFFNQGLSPELEVAFDEFILLKKDESSLFENQEYRDLMEKSKPI